MKKFKFTLQGVHDLRERREETELMALSHLNREADLASERLSSVERSLTAAVDNYNSKTRAGTPISAFELEMNADHISALERRKVAAREELKTRKDACTRQITVVASAAQAVKVTGKLRENQAVAHKMAAAKSEQTAIDEMATAGFARRAGESK